MAGDDSCGPTFLGLGAQKAASSWIYACLAQHPLIYIPEKEIHFFSRDDKWRRGYGWYESLFASAPRGSARGEFSTSYLACPEAAERIHRRYPQVRCMACLRNPVDRAFSNFMNDVMMGRIDPSESFLAALERHQEYVCQGLYHSLLKPFLDLFGRRRLLILVYEDIANGPAEFLSSIHRFLEVSPHRPEMLHRRINPSRRLRSAAAERSFNAVSSGLRRLGPRRLWWNLKKMGVGDLARRLNTIRTPPGQMALSQGDRERVHALFADDIHRLSRLLDRPLEQEWRP